MPDFSSSQRCIDYAISTEKNAIVSQRAFEEYQLSDHKILEIDIICPKKTIVEAAESTIFDRYKIQEFYVRETIKNCIEIPDIEQEHQYEIFKLKIEKTFKENKIIRQRKEA
jgi:hypothetical protein